MEEEPQVHRAVLIQEVLEAFAPIQNGVLIDMTIGAGGHAHALLSREGSHCTLIGFDRDEAILAHAKNRLAPFEDRVTLECGAFDEAPARIKKTQEMPVKGILFDLGVSSLQLDDPSRGFSFGGDGPLDMRMDRDQDLTAEAIVNRWSAEELERIFREYGEEPRARAVAKAIIDTRRRIPLKTTGALASLVSRYAASGSRKGPRKNPATRVFQALRIAVNKELERVQKGLELATQLLAPGGRLAVISFHSLEDRLVKTFFRNGASTGDLRTIHRKPISASAEELEQNRRARSAKLRVAEKVNSEKVNSEKVNSEKVNSEKANSE